MPSLVRKGERSPRVLIYTLLGVLGVVLAVLAFWRPWRAVADSSVARLATTPAPALKSEPESSHDTAAQARQVVRLGAEQQRAAGVKTAPAEMGPTTETFQAPGRITPDESHYAYITPRAAGLVRSVAAHIGQEVKAGDLLALIDSSEVAQARLDLLSRLQDLEIAETQAEWQTSIYKTTLELLERLRAGDSPDEIHRRFENRPVGENREKLVTAYADYRLAKLTFTRTKELHDQAAVSLSQLQRVQAEYESAMAVYQGLLDRTGHEATLVYNRALQAKRQADTAVRVARERLRVLGVQPDGGEPQVVAGKVQGVRSDGTVSSKLAPASTSDQIHEAIHDATAGNTPVSTYAIWAPFDGTVLDREMLVPGVAVDITHRIFTMANLSTVWVEANIPESHFAQLTRSAKARLRLTSPAYPGREFDGEVIYTGDLVDPTSLTVKLLARAENPGRLLKPGMYVEATIECQGTTQALSVPTSALLTERTDTMVYVRTGADQFEARRVVAGPSDGPRTPIFQGLSAGDEVVIEGAFALKAIARNPTGLLTADTP